MSETREEREKRHEVVQERLSNLNLDFADAQCRIQAFFQKLVIVAPQVLDNLKKDEDEDDSPEDKWARIRKGLNGSEKFIKLCREHADDFIRMGQVMRRYADLGEPFIQELREDARRDGADLGEPT